MERSSFVNGTLGCFCDDQYDQIGWAAINTKYSRSPDSNRGPFSMICQDYLISSFFKSHFFTMSSMFTFLSNTVLILSMEPLLKSICSSNQLSERLCISAGLFVCLIVDSCCIPILVRADLREQLGGQINGFAAGKNTDFGSSWYPDQGMQLLLNMIILSLRPVINVCFEWMSL